MRFEEVLHQDKFMGWDAEICYWGANHNPNQIPVFRNVCHTKIILEIRTYETIVLTIEKRPLIHGYMDASFQTRLIPCYSIEEVLSEKLRALLQRKRGEARDFYDIWYIATNYPQNINWTTVKNVFHQKCEFKNVTFNDPSDFFLPIRMKQVEITWDKRLKHQLSNPADFTEVVTGTKEVILNIFPG